MEEGGVFILEEGGVLIYWRREECYYTGGGRSVYILEEGGVFIVEEGGVFIYCMEECSY